jgi:Mrp family chromosome partitioning ATPase
MNWRTFLDASPVAQIALALMRDATGREAPLEPLAPTRPAGLPVERGVAFWSLSAGSGASTVAALVAHRSASAGRPPVLIDLDRRVPVLALRAKCAGATITDALLHPGNESQLLSRWAEVALLPGSPELHRAFDGPRIGELLGRLHQGRAIVVDLGTGAEALDPDVIAAIDRLCIVVGPSVAQLQAAFCAVPLLQQPIATARLGLVVVGTGTEDAARIASRLPWPFLASVPRDPFLANDDFATGVPTLRGIDALIRGIG